MGHKHWERTCGGDERKTLLQSSRVDTMGER
jgi:hypothetical protein